MLFRSPRAVIERISRELNAVLKRASVKEAMERQGYSVRSGSPEEFAAVVRENIATWKKIVQETGIPLE